MPNKFHHNDIVSVHGPTCIDDLEKLSECDEFLCHLMQRDSCEMIKQYEVHRNNIEQSVEYIMSE